MQGRDIFCYYYVPKLEFFFRIREERKRHDVDQMKNQIDIYYTYIRRYRQNKDQVDAILL